MLTHQDYLLRYLCLNMLVATLSVTDTIISSSNEVGRTISFVYLNKNSNSDYFKWNSNTTILAYILSSSLSRSQSSCNKLYPITKKNALKVSTLNLLIMTGYGCKTRDITLKAIYLEICSFLTKKWVEWWPWKRQSGGTACGALVYGSNYKPTRNNKRFWMK